MLNFNRYPFDSAHDEIIDSLVDDEDEELTSDMPSNISTILLGDEDSFFDDDNQDSTKVNHVLSL